MTGGENAGLFNRLKADAEKGEVFPAVRKNELHFYYRGGCLYKFAGGSFKRDKNFGKIKTEEQGLSEYEIAKKQNELRFMRHDGKIMERQLLDALNRHTFDFSYSGNTVVLDIEVDLNGTVGRGKKCDIVLLNKRTNELMFVEGKVFSDRRVNVAVSFTPEVINQVNTYTSAIAEQNQSIIEQYARHIGILNGLFKTCYRPPEKVIKPAKLLVFGTPATPGINGKYSIDRINAFLGAENVLWVKESEEPCLDSIWKSLT